MYFRLYHVTGDDPVISKMRDNWEIRETLTEGLEHPIGDAAGEGVEDGVRRVDGDPVLDACQGHALLRGKFDYTFLVNDQIIITQLLNVIPRLTHQIKLYASINSEDFQIQPKVHHFQICKNGWNGISLILSCTYKLLNVMHQMELISPAMSLIGAFTFYLKMVVLWSQQMACQQQLHLIRDEKEMMTLIYAGGATYLPVLLCESLEGAEYGRVVGDDEVGLLLHALLQHVLRQVVRQHHPRH